jgi:hypothetical protein
MANSESVGKKIVEALKKQAENIDEVSTSSFETESEQQEENSDIFASGASDDIFAEAEPVIKNKKSVSFFDDAEEENEPFFAEPKQVQHAPESNEGFEMPANIAVLRKLISQLPSGVSRHTGAQIIKQTMEALGISMKSVLQDAQQVQESLKISARECQAAIQEYKKQILMLEKQSQNYQKQYSALNDLISLFIQTTK